MHEGPPCIQGQVTLGGEDIYWAWQSFVACARLKDSSQSKRKRPLSTSPASFLRNFLLREQ